MNKKSILKFGVFVVAFFVSVLSVNAKTIYTAYKVGDKITVNVNDNKKLDFYVVSDSNEESSTVEAVFEETSYPTKTSYKDINSTLESFTSEWTNITDISIPNMQKLIGLDASTLKESGKFTTPTYAIRVSSYWLSDAGKNDEVVGHWAIGSNLNDEGAYAVYNDEQTLSIRPLINVSKEKVVDGSYIIEEDSMWNDFVEKFKNTELIKLLNDEENTSIDVTSTSDSLKVVFNDGTNLFETNFKYKDGVVTYVPSNDNKNEMIGSILVVNCIYTISNIKGYEFDKIEKLLTKDNEYTIEKDGIEFKLKQFSEEIDSSGVNGFVTSEAFESFKLDIKNGFANIFNDTEEQEKEEEIVEEEKKDEVLEEEKKDEVVENPNTGDSGVLGVVAIIALIIGFAAYIKIKKYSKFPQA